MTPGRGGFVPPVYPFDKLTEFRELASGHEGGAVDLSVGTPCDPPAPGVVAALSESAAENGYPPAVGSPELLEAAADYLARRFAQHLEPGALAACVGTKEFIAGLPHLLRLRAPERDTVLLPSLAYPTYEMGAVLAGCRAVAVPASKEGRLDLSAVSEEDAGRALCLFVNSPGNPAGALEDLAECASFGRSHGVPVFSDECYVDFTWRSDEEGNGRLAPGHSIVEQDQQGVVAVHSLSKRSNLAGLRVGFYAGDENLVGYLAAVRRHAGLMVPGPAQHAAAVALADDASVAVQRERYLERLLYLASALGSAGIDARLPEGGFYLWVEVPDGHRSRVSAPSGESPAFSFGRWLAERAGAIVSPGDAYGEAGRAHVRLAVVQPMERLKLVAERLAAVKTAA